MAGDGPCTQLFSVNLGEEMFTGESEPIEASPVLSEIGADETPIAVAKWGFGSESTELPLSNLGAVTGGKYSLSSFDELCCY